VPSIFILLYWRQDSNRSGVGRGGILSRGGRQRSVGKPRVSEGFNPARRTLKS